MAEFGEEEGNGEELGGEAGELSRKKSELLERLHRLSDRVKEFDTKTLKSEPNEVMSPVVSHTEERRFSMPTEFTKQAVPPTQIEICPPQKLSNGVRQEEISRVLRSVQSVLSDHRFFNDDYRRSIAHLNDIQNRSKLACGKIERVLEQLHRKQHLPKEQSIPHLMDQLQVCLRNQPAALRTLEQLREEYDVVVSPYM